MDTSSLATFRCYVLKSGVGLQGMTEVIEDGGKDDLVISERVQVSVLHGVRVCLAVEMRVSISFLWDCLFPGGCGSLFVDTVMLCKLCKLGDTRAHTCAVLTSGKQYTFFCYVPMLEREIYTCTMCGWTHGEKTSLCAQEIVTRAPPPPPPPPPALPGVTRHSPPLPSLLP